jgi:hypothetical protein
MNTKYKSMFVAVSASVKELMNVKYRTKFVTVGGTIMELMSLCLWQ